MEMEKGINGIQVLVESIMQDIRRPLHVFLPKCSIFRVPKLLHEGNEDAYTPIVVSIGPYHRDDERLRSMESYKLVALRSISPNTIYSILKTIKSHESEIRACYADPTDLSSDDLCRMVLTDSIFIIKFLQACTRPNGEIDNSAFGRVRFEEIKRDLLLLENQLPWFILNKIHLIVTNGPLTMAVFKFFHINVDNLRGRDLSFMSFDSYDTCDSPVLHETLDSPVLHETPDSPDHIKAKHLLQVVLESYRAILVKNVHPGLRPCKSTVSPTTTKLHAAGVKIQLMDPPRTAEHFLSIEFDEARGTLRIPKFIAADDPTQSLFRNMMALEQCMYMFDQPTYITDYCYFLDCLINTPQDVQLLADAGIIDNWLGSDVVCHMYNAISKNTRILPWNYTYAKLSEHLNNHCRRSWNYHKASFMEKYFTHPWAPISVIYAGILLLLTIAQVVTAIMAVPGVSPKQ